MLQLGNRLEQWSYDDFNLLYQDMLISTRQRVSLRTTRIASIEGQRYRISPERMLRLCDSLIAKGFKRDELLIDESAPDYAVVLQAEIMRTERFLYVRCALRSGVGMREALLNSKHIEGIRAMLLLRQHLDTESMDTLERLLTEYPDSVVELSTYPFAVGVLGSNTIFWEVRNY